MYFKIIGKILILFLISIIFIGSAIGVFADEASTCAEGGQCTLKDAFKTDADGNKDPLDSAASAAKYNTAEAKTSPNFIIGVIIKSVLSFLGIIFVGLTVYGGFLWMTAAGNDERVEKAKNLITAAVIGVIIIAASYAISYFVISKIITGVLK